METWVLGWVIVAGCVVADKRRLRKELRDKKEHVRHCTVTLGRRVSELEREVRHKEVWKTMIRGVLESTN